MKSVVFKVCEHKYMNIRPSNYRSWRRHCKEILETYQLSQLITEPTRITANSCTLNDHYITSTPEEIVRSGVIHTGISDHNIFYGVRKVNPVLNTR